MIRLSSFIRYLGKVIMLDIKAEIEKAYNAKRARESQERLGIVSGGNAGVQTADGTFVCGSSSSCPRIVLLRANGIQGHINFASILTFESGFAVERAFEYLSGSDQFQNWRSQERLEKVLPSGTKWYGTPDFSATVNGKLVIFDTKSLNSVSVFIDFIRNEETKIEYIAQLSLYMYEKVSKWGFLAACTTPWVSEKFLTAGTKEKTGGSIKPDLYLLPLVINGNELKFRGKVLEFTMEDVLRHRDTCGELVKTRTVGPRPKDKKPCWGCDFRHACDLYDAGYDKSFESFVEAIKETDNAKA